MSKIPLFFIKRLHLAPLICVLLPSLASAAPWIDAGDGRLRHHVQMLADAALIRVPVNSYPLMWSGVITEVKRVKGQRMTVSQRRSLRYVENAFLQQTQNWRFRANSTLAEQSNPLRGFDDTARDALQLSVSAEYMGGRWAARGQLNWADEPLDGWHYTGDGSYVSVLLGNWAVTAGAIDRWWGPSAETALILSNNARPVPGVSLQRNSSEPFELSVLRWLGPWQLQVFAGDLGDDPDVPSAKLLGLRLNVRPLPWLELGASRTAQWGGQGRPESFDSLQNLILGNDNLEEGRLSIADEPGNQLGGIDWRASWNFARGSIDFYGELIGEDEAGGLPSRQLVTLGVGSSFSLAGDDFRLYAESSDTTARRVVGKPHFNYTYEHALYPSGYRYRGRAIGATVDNDSRAHHLVLQWFADMRSSVKLKLSQFDLNTDVRGSNSVADGGSNSYAASLTYAYQYVHWHFQAAYYHYNDKLGLQEIDTGDDSIALQFGYSW